MQHRRPSPGQGISSLTSSQRRLASAWMHLPGHSVDSAVFVIVPRRPEKKYFIIEICTVASEKVEHLARKVDVFIRKSAIA